MKCEVKTLQWLLQAADFLSVRFVKRCFSQRHKLKWEKPWAVFSDKNNTWESERKFDYTVQYLNHKWWTDMTLSHSDLIVSQSASIVLQTSAIISLSCDSKSEHIKQKLWFYQQLQFNLTFNVTIFSIQLAFSSLCLCEALRLYNHWKVSVSWMQGTIFNHRLPLLIRVLFTDIEYCLQM